MSKALTSGSGITPTCARVACARVWHVHVARAMQHAGYATQGAGHRMQDVGRGVWGRVAGVRSGSMHTHLLALLVDRAVAQSRNKPMHQEARKTFARAFEVHSLATAHL